MQPLHTRRSNRSHRSYYRENTLFYLALFIAEAAMLGGFLLFDATTTWPIWKVASIVLADMLFVLLASAHRTSRASGRLGADMLLVGLSMLVLVALSVFVSPDVNGFKIVSYAWICALLVNILHYYPGRQIKARRRF